MQVLVVGSGAREHAIVRALANDPDVEGLFCAPGNAGMGQQATVYPIDVSDPAAIVELATGVRADLVVIGPEVPLVNGAVDALSTQGIAAFGPTKAAAELEGSKAFAKEVMEAAGVPTARAAVCSDLASVNAAFDEFGAPHVVKDDGLAAGKGVVVTDDRAAALEHALACLAKAGARVVIEEFLDGPEVSLFCVTDGTTVVPLQPAQDFKRVGDGDSGPNTGGMGAYTPLDWAPSNLVQTVVATVAQPTINEMQRRGTPFAGLLYIGLALTSRGIRVVEFNARFGDPETQVVLAQLESPLSALLHASATGTLAALPALQWRAGAAVTVVLAANGYPTKPVTGDPIEGIPEAELVPDVHVLHAGTASDEEGQLISAGGRVLSVVAQADDLAGAAGRAYEAIGKIDLVGSHYRSDIAETAIRGMIQVPTESTDTANTAEVTT